MEADPQIIFRGTDATEELKSDIAARIAELELVHDRITSCRITLEKRNEKGRKGHLFQVCVDLEVPGGVINVGHKPGDIAAHENLNVALRDSFNAARRQLREYARKQDGLHVKTHPETWHGAVVRVFADEGYGFIETDAGEEVYFQRDSVVSGDWDKFRPGAKTAFSVMDGEKGLYAVNLSLRG